MIKRLMLCLSLVAMVLMASCVSSKKIVYFQGADELYTEAQKIEQHYQMRIKPADNLLVKITCSNPELLEVFSNDVVMGTGSNGSGNISNMNGSSLNNVYGYTVDNEGNVILPQIGKVRVMGHTAEECALAIEQAIKDQKLITDPVVTVRLMNASVTVLGGVKAPGVVPLTSERTSILDVLSKAGDVADDGLRTNIRLFREVNGERVMYTLDLTDVEVFKSPAFFMQQNDLVYVQHNKSKNIRTSAFYAWLGAGSSILGLTSTVLSLILLFKRWD